MDLVELGGDDDREVAAVERERERLLRAREPRGHRDGDLLGREHVGERTRLLDALGREALARAPCEDATPSRFEPANAMPDEQQLAHG